MPDEPDADITILSPLELTPIFAPAVILTGLKSVNVEVVDTRDVPVPPLLNVYVPPPPPPVELIVISFPVSVKVILDPAVNDFTLKFGAVPLTTSEVPVPPDAREDTAPVSPFGP